MKKFTMLIAKIALVVSLVAVSNAALIEKSRPGPDLYVPPSEREKEECFDSICLKLGIKGCSTKIEQQAVSEICSKVKLDCIIDACKEANLQCNKFSQIESMANFCLD